MNTSCLRFARGLALAAFASMVTLAHADLTPRGFSELKGGLVVLLACGDARAGDVAAELGKSGDNVVHVLAGTRAEVDALNARVAKAGLKGIVTVEELKPAPLPYRDYLVNSLVVMDRQRAEADGFTMAEARRVVAPFGHVAFCRAGKLDRVETMPQPDTMDVWTHRYYQADGVPVSADKLLDLPVGYKWNADLPMNFDDPTHAANRYSSTRAMVVDDGRVFTFSCAVIENLGQGWRSKYGADQYLTARDAFNGRLLWRKRIGDTYYGGLYIENLAPLISTGRHLYLAGENGKMLKVDTRTGDTVAEMNTKFIPGVIAAADGIVVAATWKDGKEMGSIKRYDRRRMDWAIAEGTIEAYDAKTDQRLWKQDLLGTSMLIAEGRVFIVSRDQKDDLELAHKRKEQNPALSHPPNRVFGLDLKTGKMLWKSEAERMGLLQETLNLEAAGWGAVSVARGDRRSVTILAAATGKPLEGDAKKEAEGRFFRYRNHICTPAYRVNGLELNNRGGVITDTKDSERHLFGGARSACLTGTIPAYGAGYIAQNWCNCSPGQENGLLAVAAIGRIPTPREMEAPARPIPYGSYSEGEDGVGRESNWSSFRGNPTRSSSSPATLSDDIKETWSVNVATAVKSGTVARDWSNFLNSRLTAPVLSEQVAIVGDMDQNEVIAVNLQSGKVAWRHAVGGRMDTSPTVYKGLCLIGDHAGYVTALKVRNGELVYRLRVAPFEKRMLSYGKVESVWPVIGGVLVVDGRAFATAGRTQGSDGGIIVRAFEPETGEPVWARALPQSGNGVQPGKAKRNDALILEDGKLRLMDHYLDADTGEIVPSPVKTRVETAVAAKEKELGRKLDRIERQRLENEIAKKGELSLGNEGITSWNWTRLGHRKFQSIGYRDLKGDTVSWAGDTITITRGNTLQLAANGQTKGIRLPNGSQPTALVLCKNLLVQGGSLVDQGDQKGFIRAIDLNSGQIAWEKTYPAELAFNGLAVDQDQIIASFNDGSVVKLK